MLVLTISILSSTIKKVYWFRQIRYAIKNNRFDIVWFPFVFIGVGVYASNAMAMQLERNTHFALDIWNNEQYE